MGTSHKCTVHPGMSGGLVACGLLTGVAVAGCICLGENLGFNMLMCVFCLVAIAGLWTNEKEVKLDGKDNKETQTKPEEKTEQCYDKKL